ncbi:hypothetical protein LCGC14_1867730 [marine sediment metagenome]|uniref:site-specific DNA-methyltransferase (cytosine-N(4)-specific) n=1 Tax=marine sediment metagenome TaxID=412755 RepID=A0A0F9G5X8_9ZZZZ
MAARSKSRPPAGTHLRHAARAPRGRRVLRIRAKYSKRNDATLRCGDSKRFLASLPDDSAQLVITSPPYNLGKAYERKAKLDEYLNFQRQIIAECVRITRDGGSICWQVGNSILKNREILPLDTLIHPLFAEHRESCGIRLRNRIVWHFEHGLHCSQRFSGRYETILWYTVGDPYLFNLDPVRVPQKYPGKKHYQGNNRGKPSGNPLGKNPGDFWVFRAEEDRSDVWVFPNVKGNHVEKTDHPCQFPIELPARLILALSEEGDLVVDPFVGVGTTTAAAVLLRRRAAGVDRLREYVETARRRARAVASGRLRYRAIGKPVYEPRPNTPLTTPPPGFVNHKG